MATIYENIRQICAERGISQNELENMAGIGHGIVGRWQKTTPNITSLQKVAEALKVKLTDLLEEAS